MLRRLWMSCGSLVRAFGVLMGVSLGLAACGGSEAVTEPAPYGDAGDFPPPAFRTFTTDQGYVQIELRTAPAQPPVVGPGEFQLHITDPGTFEPIDGLTLTVTTWMPAMNRAGSKLKPLVIPAGSGIYVVKNIVFDTPGKVEVKVTVAGPRSGSAVSPMFNVTP